MTIPARAMIEAEIARLVDGAGVPFLLHWDRVEALRWVLAEVLPEPAAGGGDRRVTIGPDAENGNNRRLFVDGSQWAKIYGWDDESVEARANEIVAALSAAPSPRQLDEGVIEAANHFVDWVDRHLHVERIAAVSPKELRSIIMNHPAIKEVRAALAAIASPLDGGGK